MIIGKPTPSPGRSGMPQSPIRQAIPDAGRSGARGPARRPDRLPRGAVPGPSHGGPPRPPAFGDGPEIACHLAGAKAACGGRVRADHRAAGVVRRAHRGGPVARVAPLVACLARGQDPRPAADGGDRTGPAQGRERDCPPPATPTENFRMLRTVVETARKRGRDILKSSSTSPDRLIRDLEPA